MSPHSYRPLVKSLVSVLHPSRSQLQASKSSQGQASPEKPLETWSCCGVGADGLDLTLTTATLSQRYLPHVADHVVDLELHSGHAVHELTAPSLIMATPITMSLNFINVHASGKKPWIDKGQRRQVRITVMRDHVRSKIDSDHPYRPASVSSNIEAHLSKFRSEKAAPNVRQRKLGERRSLRPSPPNEEGSDSATTPDPHDVQGSPQQLNPSRILSGIDVFQIFPIPMADPETLALAEYYMYGYWSNSYATNPRGEWTAFALTDSAIMHAKLSLVALHRADRLRQPLPEAYLRHRGNAINLIRGRLNNPSEALTDTTIAAVVLLASSDEHSFWSQDVKDSHIRGMEAMVRGRGGIDSPTVTKALRRVTAWVDLLQAGVNEAPLVLERSTSARKPAREELDALMPEPVDWQLLYRNLNGEENFPYPVEDIIRQLRILSLMKAALLKNRTKELCEAFSDMVWQMEYDRLDLVRYDNADSMTDGRSAIFARRSGLEAFAVAALIYCFSELRDQNSIVIFSKLTKRLRTHLSRVMRNLPASKDGELSTSEHSLLVWMLYVGWRGAKLSDEEEGFFVTWAAVFRVANSHSPAVSIEQSLKSVVLMDVSTTEQHAESFSRAVEELISLASTHRQQSG